MYGCVYTYRCARVSMSEYSCRQSLTSVSAPTLLIARVGTSAEFRAQHRAHIAASASLHFLGSFMRPTPGPQSGGRQLDAQP